LQISGNSEVKKEKKNISIIFSDGNTNKQMKERIKQGKNKSLNNNNKKKGQNQSHKFPFTSKNGL